MAVTVAVSIVVMLKIDGTGSNKDVGNVGRIVVSND